MAESMPHDATNSLGSSRAADVVVRASRDDDVEALLAIYRYHARSGIGPLGNYEIDEPQLDDTKRRGKNMKNRRLPHLVADWERTVVGYAYAVPFRKRPAYRYAVKHSIKGVSFAPCGITPSFFWFSKI
jgi:phosphinothricin acetyltransferase